MAVLVALLGCVLLPTLVLVAGLLRSHAEILRTLHDLGVDLDPHPSVTPKFDAMVPRPRTGAREAVDIVGTTPAGDVATIAVADTGRPTLLAFLTTGCATCASFWSALADPRARPAPGGARVVVVTKGPEAESPARVGTFDAGRVPVVMSSEAWVAYDVQVAPYFAYVHGGSNIVVGEGSASTWDHLVSMMEQALADAGLPTNGRHRRRSESARARAADVDRALSAAGIQPGDPSLYPTGAADVHGAGRQRGPGG